MAYLTKPTANSIRHRASKLHYNLRSAKNRKLSSDNLGGYMLTKFNGEMVIGENYSCTLDEIITFLCTQEKLTPPKQLMGITHSKKTKHMQEYMKLC